MSRSNASAYRGRLAPTPSGHLHLGHARTFWTAQQRARAAGGTLILRNEDLDPERCRPEFAAAMIDDLRWFGCDWSEGPDRGGPFAPYTQSERRAYYTAVWRELCQSGRIYPSPHSRKDIASALVAPHDDVPGEPAPRGTAQPGAASADVAAENEAIFPTALRPADATYAGLTEPAGVNWRFRVPDGEAIEFADGRCGIVRRVAGVDFGDFLVWRKDGYPSYELAVVADDRAMQITEVVRGEDLLTSTARQLLLYRALGFAPPAFYHCPLMLDDAGQRLAKRSDAVSLRALRAAGKTPAELRRGWT